MLTLKKLGQSSIAPSRANSYLDKISIESRLKATGYFILQPQIRSLIRSDLNGMLLLVTKLIHFKV